MSDRRVSRKTLKLIGAISGVLVYWATASPGAYLGLDDQATAALYAAGGALAVTLLEWYLPDQHTGPPPFKLVDVPFIADDEKEEE